MAVCCNCRHCVGFGTKSRQTNRHESGTCGEVEAESSRGRDISSFGSQIGSTARDPPLYSNLESERSQAAWISITSFMLFCFSPISERRWILEGTMIVPSFSHLSHGPRLQQAYHRVFNMRLSYSLICRDAPRCLQADLSHSSCPPNPSDYHLLARARSLLPTAPLRPIFSNSSLPGLAQRVSSFQIRYRAGRKVDH